MARIITGTRGQLISDGLSSISPIKNDMVIGNEHTANLALAQGAMTQDQKDRDHFIKIYTAEGKSANEMKPLLESMGLGDNILDDKNEVTNNYDLNDGVEPNELPASFKEARLNENEYTFETVKPAELEETVSLDDDGIPEFNDSWGDAR